MKTFLLRRLWQSLVVLLGVSFVVFLILHLTGDPALVLLPPDASAARATARSTSSLMRCSPNADRKYFVRPVKRSSGGSRRSKQTVSPMT